MTLKSFGCSFIFGSDLPDDVSTRMLDWSNNGIYIRPSSMTWPALLAKQYKYDYISYALPGIGNLQILESILKQIRAADNDIFVIQWSWIDRFDYENAQRTNRDNFWNTILPTDQDFLATEYFKCLHSQYRDKLSTLIYINAAIAALNQNNIRYIMTSIDGLIFEEVWHSNAAIDLLQQTIKPHLFSFDGLSFIDWAAKNQYPVSSSMHPLEQAHQAAAELLISYNLI